MKKWLLGATALMFGLLIVMSDGMVVAGDDQGKVPTPDEIMRKLNGKNGVFKAVSSGLKANPVDWAKVQTQTKEYADTAAQLGKNDPPKGEKASWEKLTKAFADTAKEMNADAEKKDKDATVAAQGKIQGMCMNCHRAHR